MSNFNIFTIILLLSCSGLYAQDRPGVNNVNILDVVYDYEEDHIVESIAREKTIRYELVEVDQSRAKIRRANYKKTGRIVLPVKYTQIYLYRPSKEEPKVDRGSLSAAEVSHKSSKKLDIIVEKIECSSHVLTVKLYAKMHDPLDDLLDYYRGSSFRTRKSSSIFYLNAAEYCEDGVPEKVNIISN